MPNLRDLSFQEFGVAKDLWKEFKLASGEGRGLLSRQFLASSGEPGSFEPGGHRQD
jgi:hypothetical protein